MDSNRLDIAKSLKEKYLDSYPVNLESIAKDNNIDVENEYMGEMSGKIVKVNDNYRITINLKHSPQRRRFTLAHELAHFFLHKESIGDGIFDDPLYRSLLSNNQEIQANKLAADIIMPLHKVKERANHYIECFDLGFHAELAHILANEFDVSFGAMSIRLGI